MKERNDPRSARNLHHIGSNLARMAARLRSIVRHSLTTAFSGKSCDRDVIGGGFKILVPLPARVPKRQRI
jgi:hypothetical protein